LLPRQKWVAVKAKPASGAAASNGYAHRHSSHIPVLTREQARCIVSDAYSQTPIRHYCADFVVQVI
ncbi:MAG: hypothetical protein RR736_24985, partial [Pseudomonas sp.]